MRGCSQKLQDQNRKRCAVKGSFQFETNPVGHEKSGGNTDRESAIPIYESILKLYGEVKWGIIDEADEGRELVNKARIMLDAMRAAQKKQTEEDAANTEKDQLDQDSR